MTCGVAKRRMVWPSGALFATKSAPMVPPAPGRFSTNTCLPSAVERRGVSSRAGTSANPPGESGTTSRIGRDGHAWARTSSVETRSKTQSAERIIRDRPVLLGEKAVQKVIHGEVVLLLEARVRDPLHDRELLVRMRQAPVEGEQVVHPGDAVVLAAQHESRHGDLRRVDDRQLRAHVDIG